MTLGGLLDLGYNVVVSYKRASTSVIEGSFSNSLETIDTLGETYLVLRGINRKVCIIFILFSQALASRMVNPLYSSSLYSRYLLCHFSSC